jgi:hypothetical protein
MRILVVRHATERNVERLRVITVRCAALPFRDTARRADPESSLTQTFPFESNVMPYRTPLRPPPKYGVPETGSSCVGLRR